MRIAIGIDPGNSGAIAFYNGQDFLKVSRNTSSPFEIYHNFERILLDPNNALITSTFFALMEKVNPRPGEGVVSSFTFGKSFGYLEMLLVSNSIKHELISPQAWMKLFAPNRPKYKANPEITDKKAIARMKAKVKSERKRYIRDEVLRRCPSARGLAIQDADACALAILAWEWKKEF